jgi:hypothetical protein
MVAMANPEHLDLLKRGVEIWNESRRRFPKIEPDLSNADLEFCNLEKANLSKANLEKTSLLGAYLVGARFKEAQLDNANLDLTNLSNANFNGASLWKVTLRESIICNAQFCEAYLSCASFHDSKLSRSNYYGADLTYANLGFAELDDTNFAKAKIGWTTFGNNDLSVIKGIDTFEHVGPSVIGIDTIYKSKGNIPEVFLRGCGVPDQFITYAQSLKAHPIQFYSCFISYSNKDKEFVERLHVDLQNKGVRCWFAPENLKIGDKIRDRIDESIRLRDKLLLILSENSIASDWVEHEVESALEEEGQKNRIILFPIRVDNAVMGSNKAWAALIRRTRHIGDFTDWKNHNSYQKAFDRLLRDLKTDE